MLKDRNSLSRHRRWICSRAAASSIAVLAFACGGAAVAKAPTQALQGLFCNAAEPIDEALAHMHRGLSPRVAAELINRDEVVCTFVDSLHYVVDRPVLIKEIRGSSPLFKYQGMLVAVVVGRAIRPLTPPVSVFFAIPERLANATVEGRA